MDALEALNRELLDAAESGDLKAAEECLKNGADVHYSRWNKETPLHKAAKGDHTDMASLLISAGADIHSQDDRKQTPLHVALENNHKDMAALLVSKGADIKIQYNFELFNAAESGDLKAAEECLKNGADVHYKDGWNKETPLHKAAKGDHTDMASLLISAGADIHSQDDRKQTPLHVALENNHKDMAALLVSKGADIKIQYNFVCIPQ